MSDSPEPRQLSDAAALRALRHPLRKRIMRVLDRDGPATATSLARALGENTGATSYHLRQLAAHGFIEEASEHGSGRERWWRVPRHDLRFPPRSRMSPEMRRELAKFEQFEAVEDAEALARFQARRDLMGKWGDAELFARGELALTLPQVTEFWNDYMALFTRYVQASDPPDPDARTILVRFMAFPEVD
ncbi:Helix-turn-helix domain-containing protein [Actinomadura madurae]|uniref:Helix-turn-helix domain-containing protein n=1 Tax=Actinomadura madurae TaxID=1993 RepID=A0A1I5NPL5_9ACTN|nr:helix-turn-helix domain-containing protein [Actinomadura madurae]SFP23246.1 Helix-turn-helix domain-containing protein [Actinomadura madurae]